MQRLFEVLSDAAQAGPMVALGAAFVWGILSIVLSPCHLASIPLIIGFIDGQGPTTTRRAFTAALLFALGILITIGLVGAVTAAAGRMMGDVGSAGTYVVAAIFLMIGLHLMDVIPLPLGGVTRVGMKRKGLAAALVLGLVFGLALGPCTFAYMAPVLTVVFTVATSQFIYGLLLLLAYGVGHCAVIVVAGTSTELVQRYLNWNDRARGSIWLKRACGTLVVAGGLYILYAAPSPARSTAADAATPPAQDPERVIAYYFHGTIRCVTCTEIERIARETVETRFINDIGAGRLQWQSVNYDVDANRRYQDDYQLSMPSLVLVRFQGDEQRDWVTLEETWARIGEGDDALAEYVHHELREFVRLAR